MKKFLKATLAAALVVAGLSANAAGTVNLTGAVGYGSTAGRLTIGTSTYNLDAEEWQLTTSTGKSFAAYCIDASTLLAIPPGLYAETVVTSAVYDSIAKLFAVSGFEGDGFKFDGVDTKVKASALQLAIWETYYEGGALATANAFTTGNMTATFFGNAKSQAQAYLTAAASLTPGEYDPAVVVFSALPSGSRSQLLVTSIPEPSTYALMAACLGVMGLVSRRKQA